MNLEKRLDILNKIYGLYNDVVNNLDVACKKDCSACCTPHVTMTTLEGYLIADHMITNGQTGLFENIQPKISKNRFKPKITTNRLADLCMREDDLPEEEKKQSNKSKIKDNLKKKFGPYALKELEIAFLGARPNTCYGISMDKAKIEIVY